MLEPVWSCGPVLPNSLVDLLDTGDLEEEEEEEENEDEFLTLTTSVKVMVNDDLKIIILKPMRDCGAALRIDHAGLLFTDISK